MGGEPGPRRENKGDGWRRMGSLVRRYAGAFTGSKVGRFAKKAPDVTYPAASLLAACHWRATSSLPTFTLQLCSDVSARRRYFEIKITGLQLCRDTRDWGTMKHPWSLTVLK